VSIIAGDFNFSDGSEEDQAIEGYVDVWKQGKRYFSPWAKEEQKKTGYTMPGTPRFPAWRPDHIIYRSLLKPKGKEEEIEIIGDFSL
jgi:hypothetical protein